MSPTESATKQKAGRGMSGGAGMLVGALLALTIAANGVRLIGTAEAVQQMSVRILHGRNVTEA